MLPVNKENVSRLIPENQFPEKAIDSSVQVQPEPNAPFSGSTIILSFASIADSLPAWGSNTKKRDFELRKFWPTEPYLAGAVATVSARNAAYDWEIESSSEAVVNSVTDMLMRAIAGDKFGWVEFIKRFSQDLYTTDNGCFVELIRDETVDANSKFKGEFAPVIGIANIDSNQCLRTGNMEYPVLYEDRQGELHKMKWYQVIPFSDFPSSIEKMNGVGYCTITRSFRLAQLMKNQLILRDEKAAGRNPKDIHLVGGVAQSSITDAIKRTKENADNLNNARYIENVVLASLDPEKPVSVATLALASVPEEDYGQLMEWFISGLALNFGVDYQEFAPLPSGNIGSSAQSQILSKKTSGKGPRNFMDSITIGFQNYGVLPRNAKLSFKDKNEQEELERQEVRTKALEEAAIAVNAHILTPEAAAKDLVRRGIYSEETIAEIEEDFWKNSMYPDVGQPVGNRGGNTIREDNNRQQTGKTNQNNAAGRLRKFLDKLPIRKSNASY